MLKGSTYIVRPRMRAAEQAFQLAAHVEGIFPVVGGAGAIFREGTDEGAVLDARDIVRVGAGVIAARPELLVQLDESAARDHLGAEVIVFFLRTIHPVDGGRLGQLGHLLHPLLQVFVAAQRDRGVAFFVFSNGF